MGRHDAHKLSHNTTCYNTVCRFLIHTFKKKQRFIKMENIVILGCVKYLDLYGQPNPRSCGVIGNIIGSNPIVLGSNPGNFTE